MPIPFEKLTYKDILHHQVAYENFAKVGEELFDEWDMIEFEKAVLGCGDTRYLSKAEQIMKTPAIFEDLDKTMPFLKFRENGQHYGYELFLSPPKHWGSRGAPFWWAYAARKFTYDKLPMDETYLYEKYKAVAKEFGLNINYNRYVKIEIFSAGGMSSGIVGEQFVREGWYDIRRRNRLYQHSNEQPKSLYLKKAIERMNWYIASMNEIFAIGDDICCNDFMFLMEDCDITPHQKEVVSFLWGLYTGKPMTNQETAEKFGITSSRVRQIETTCLRHIFSNKNRDILIKINTN